MWEVIIRESTPAIVKALTDAAVKIITEHPVETFSIIAIGFGCYQKGRADTCEKLIDKKNFASIC